MYKVYINGLLTELNNHSFAIAINGLTASCPSFTDDISLFDSYSSSLQSSMDNYYNYSLRWRYELSHTKSSVVTFCEDKRTHTSQMNEREWKLGSIEYKILGLQKTVLDPALQTLTIT